MGKRDGRYWGFFQHQFDLANSIFRKWFDRNDSIDSNLIERTNTQIFLPVLMSLLIISLSQALVGSRLNCSGFEGVFPKTFVKDYCWSQGIYTNKFAYNMPRDELPAPGIIPCVRIEDDYKCTEEQKKEQLVYHLWYQWIPYYFSLVYLAFYAPAIVVRYNTKLGKLRRFLTNHLLSAAPPKTYIQGDLGEPAVMQPLSFWLIIELSQRRERRLAWNEYSVPLKILGIRIYLFVAALVTFLLTGRMFHIGNFYTLGLDWNTPGTDNYTHVGDVLFPKMVGCTLQKFGHAGLVKMSGMCTMVPNVVNQYLFLVVWWALVILIGLNGLNILLTITEFVPIRFYRQNVINLLNTNTSLHETTEGYQGLTLGEIDLVLHHYDHSSHVILQRVIHAVEPVYVTAVFKHLARHVLNDMADVGGK
ncbi:hypothetical protein ACHWQZ_G016950 [Mnemiopsis leidyi]